MEKMTVMFELDSRVFELLKAEADRRDISMADILRSAVSREILMTRPQHVTAAE